MFDIRLSVCVFIVILLVVLLFWLGVGFVFVWVWFFWRWAWYCFCFWIYGLCCRVCYLCVFCWVLVWRMVVLVLVCCDERVVVLLIVVCFFVCYVGWMRMWICSPACFWGCCWVRCLWDCWGSILLVLLCCWSGLGCWVLSWRIFLGRLFWCRVVLRWGCCFPPFCKRWIFVALCVFVLLCLVFGGCWWWCVWWVCVLNCGGCSRGWGFCVLGVCFGRGLDYIVLL